MIKGIAFFKNDRKEKGGRRKCGGDRDRDSGVSGKVSLKVKKVVEKKHQLAALQGLKHGTLFSLL